MQQTPRNSQIYIFQKYEDMTNLAQDNNYAHYNFKIMFGEGLAHGACRGVLSSCSNISLKIDIVTNKVFVTFILIYPHIFQAHIAPSIFQESIAVGSFYFITVCF